jgi:hypothetical protein
VKKNVFWFAMILAFFMFNTPANANLTNNGNGLIYDDVLNVTFYDASQTAVNWYAAEAYVTNLNVNGVTGWRLPTTVSATGYYLGELGELYHSELGLSGTAVDQPTTKTELPFTTLHSYFYWTGVYAYSNGSNTNNAYYAIELDNGYQTVHWDVSSFDAIAVHDGNIGGTTPVPVPATVMLLGSGLVGLAGFRKKFKK